MNILLIHGLGRSPLSMWSLAQGLREAGHEPVFFGYVALVQSFDEIVRALRDRLRHLSTLGPYGVVSHSLGGVLARAALAEAAFPLPAHVVMLAPPNQSPRAGQLANLFLPFRWFAGQSGQNMASSAFYAQLPPLHCPYTLIAGTAGPIGSLSPFGNEVNDFVIGLTEVKMNPQDSLILIPALHSFIIHSPIAQAAVIKAFSGSR